MVLSPPPDFFVDFPTSGHVVFVDSPLFFAAIGFPSPIEKVPSFSLTANFRRGDWPIDEKDP